MDADLEAIRAKRMAELQAAGGGASPSSTGGAGPSAGAGGGEEAAQRVAMEDEMRRTMMSQILSPEARERLSRIALVKPERAKSIEQLLMRMAQSGQIRGKVSEDQLIDVLDQVEAMERGQSGAGGQKSGSKITAHLVLQPPSPTSLSHLLAHSTDQLSLKNVRAVLFDQFGTLTDWQGSISRLLEEEARKTDQSSGAGSKAGLQSIDWLRFTQVWRDGYMRRTREIASGGTGPGNIDELHLEILNDLLEKPEYAVVKETWNAEKRRELCWLWHKLDGKSSFALFCLTQADTFYALPAWPDSKPGLEALRNLDPPVLLATLSNGTLRLLVDVTRHNSLPLDAHFSGDLLSSYKPNPKMYCGASSLLGFDEDARKRGEVAMFASHIDDLRAASQHGLRTIYIRRASEDVGIPHGGAAVKPKSEGGEVDLVVDNVGELVKYLR
ncbi:double-stranded DNA-binding domain-containing protein [Rhodotorula toruloides]